LLDDQHVQRLARGERAHVVHLIRQFVRRFATLAQVRQFDLLWIHCEILPYLPGFIERLWMGQRVPIMLDYDDAIFHMYDADKRWAVRRVLGRKLEPLMRSAAAITPGNGYLADYARRLNDRVVIIPTVVDTDVYGPAVREANSTPVVGWIGSPSTWDYVEPILPELLPLLAESGAIFRAIGAGPAAKKWRGIDVRDWSETTEVSEVQSMDIGIMPLPDERWARGKCGYKLIQYMACGLPVIASPVGVNTTIVREGVNGYLVENVAGWKAALTRMLASPNLRERLGAAGRTIAVAEYSLKTYAPRMVALFQNTARGRAR
jgi:hypothetical protein